MRAATVGASFVHGWQPKTFGENDHQETPVRKQSKAATSKTRESKDETKSRAANTSSGSAPPLVPRHSFGRKSTTASAITLKYSSAPNSNTGSKYGTLDAKKLLTIPRAAYCGKYSAIVRDHAQNICEGKHTSKTEARTVSEQARTRAVQSIR